MKITGKRSPDNREEDKSVTVNKKYHSRYDIVVPMTINPSKLSGKYMSHLL
jgi:hypothetical protein